MQPEKESGEREPLDVSKTLVCVSYRTRSVVEEFEAEIKIQPGGNSGDYVRPGYAI